MTKDSPPGQVLELPLESVGLYLMLPAAFSGTAGTAWHILELPGPLLRNATCAEKFEVESEHRMVVIIFSSVELPKKNASKL